jgi:type II secretory pathway pseudopilin PulG
LWALAIVSLLTSLAMLAVVAATANDRRIEAARNGMYAALLEMRLFNDDLRAVLRATWDVLRQNVAYLRAMAVPMLWMAMPFVLLISQLDAFFAYDGLDVGHQTLVTAQLRDDVRANATGATTPAHLEAPREIEVDTDALWFPGAHQVIWRIRPVAQGSFDLHIRIGSANLVKSVRVSNDLSRRSPARPQAGLLDELQYPSEQPLSADSPVRSITLTYPTREISVLGWRMNWLTVYVALSILLAFPLKRVFGVRM